MSILFYDHLVKKTEIITFIEQLPAPDNQKGKAKQLVDDILHQGVIEFILQKLHPHQHETFLSHVQQAPYDPEIMKYLEVHIGPDIETELQKHIESLLEDIRKDLG